MLFCIRRKRADIRKHDRGIHVSAAKRKSAFHKFFGNFLRGERMEQLHLLVAQRLFLKAGS